MGLETIAGGVLGMGSVLGGGSGGGSSKTTKASPYESAIANIANTLFAESSPLRKNLTSQYEAFASGNYNPEELAGYKPLYATARSGPEDQYSLAKENTIGSTPSGGALTGALSNLENNRAQSVGSLPAQISGGLIQNLMDKAYGVAYQTPQTALSGLGAANSGYSTRQNSANIMNTQAESALGQGVGQLMGQFLGGGSGGGLGS